MLALNPALVRFAGRELPGVTLIAIDRAAQTLVEEWDDLGSSPAFVDVTAQRITIRIVQTLARSDFSPEGDALLPPAPGERGEIEFFTAPAGTSAGRRRITIQAVVTATRHDHLAAGNKPTSRTITLQAATGSGDTDPLAIEVL